MREDSSESTVENAENESTQLVPSKPVISVDYLLKQEVGALGLWQWLTAILLMLSTPSTPTFPVFANSVPRQRCRMEPELESIIANRNLTFDEAGSVIGPWYKSSFAEQNRWIGCSRYDINWTVESFNQHIDLFIHNNLTQHTKAWGQTACPHGYVFQLNELQYPDSVIVEFETVCGTDWLAPLGTSIYMFGMMCGFLLGGWCGDRFGRRPTAIAMSIAEIVFAIATSLSPNYTCYIVFRGLSATANIGRVTVYNVLMVELTLACYRSYFSALLSLGYNFLLRGLISPLALYIHNWRWLNAAVTGPAVLGLLQLFLLIESPRWLISQGRLLDALNALECGYRINKWSLRAKDPSETEPKMLKELKEETRRWLTWTADQAESERATEKLSKSKQCMRNMAQSIFRTFSTPYLIKVTTFGILLFNAENMIFFGLLLYANAVRESVYLVSFINAAMTIPAIAISTLLYRLVRYRRAPLIGVFTVTSSALLIGGLYTYIVQPVNDIVLTVTSNIAVTCAVGSMFMIYIYIPELYPSTMRSQGFGIVAGLGKIGGILCTFVNQMDREVGHGVPILFYAGVNLIQIGLLFALPNTNGENLVDVEGTIVKGIPEVIKVNIPLSDSSMLTTMAVAEDDTRVE